MATKRYYSALAQDTTLVGNITNSTTSMVVGATVGYPSITPYVLAVDYNAAAEELVLVTGISGTTLTITRGYNGTTGVSHTTGAVIRHVIIAQDLTDMSDHNFASTGVHGATSAVVGKDDVQTLTNKTIDYTANTITNLPTYNPALVFNAQTGTTYTLIASDAPKLVTLNNSNPITLTVPPSVFTVGQEIHIQQINAGQVTLAQGAGVTITSGGTTSSAPALRAQYSAATVICTGTNTFTVVGDIA